MSAAEKDDVITDNLELVKAVEFSARERHGFRT